LVVVAVFILFSHCEDKTTKRDYPLIKDTEVINITSSGATFTAEVSEAGNYPITEHGFVWGENKNLTESYSDRIYLGSFSGTGNFQSDIFTTLVAGKQYYVSAFLKAGDYLVYSKPVVFISLGSQAPVVTGFSPKAAEWGDTIFITGKNFSNRLGSNVVSFGSVDVSSLYSYCDTLIKCRFPSGVTAKKSSVSVSVVGNKGTIPGDSISLLAPELISYYPKEARYGDTISIKGRHLTEISDSYLNGLYFGTVKSTFLANATDTLIKARVPETLATINNSISIKINGITLNPGIAFTLLSPVIDSISPDTASWGNSVRLYGKFNSNTSMNSVTVGGVKATVSALSLKSIQVAVPATLTTFANSVILTSGPFTVTSPELLYLTPPQIKYFTPATGSSGTQVKIGGKYFKSGLTRVYFGTTEATIKSVNDSVIYCYAPSLANGSYPVNVSVSASTITAKTHFVVSNPVITSLSPTSVSYGDVVTVTGSGFVTGMTWSLGSYVITPALINSTQATFTVPYTLMYTPLKVSASNTVNSVVATTTSTDYLTLKDFTVTSISPLTGKGGSVLTLTGTNLNPNSLSVRIGSVNTTLSDITTTGATITVPGVTNGEFDITISTGGKALVYPSKFVVSEAAWTRLNDLPFIYDCGWVMDFGDDVFVFTKASSNTEKSLYRFNNNTLGFDKLDGVYNSQIIQGYASVIKNKAYIVGQASSGGDILLEEFDTISKKLSSLSSFPGEKAFIPMIIADDSVLYIGGGESTYPYYVYFTYQFWKYSLATGKWTRLQNVPYNIRAGNQYCSNNRIYCLADDRFVYEYKPLSNSWEMITGSSSPLNPYGGTANFSINDKWYIGFGSWFGLDFYDYSYESMSNGFAKWDPLMNKWTSIEYVPITARGMPLSFSAGKYGFIGGSQTTTRVDFYLYDPSKE